LGAAAAGSKAGSTFAMLGGSLHEDLDDGSSVITSTTSLTNVVSRIVQGSLVGGSENAPSGVAVGGEDGSGIGPMKATPSTAPTRTGTGWDHGESAIEGAREDDVEDEQEGREEEAQEKGGVYVEESLPAHACAYCGVHATASVIKCVATGKWFCNGGTGSTGNDTVVGEGGGEGAAGGDDSLPAPSQSRSGSHIIQHLVRSRHKEVATHADSFLGETVLECYNCASRNVFLLGFIPSKSDSVVVLLCREPCLTMGVLKDQGWDLSMWEPLIQDRAFLPWLVPPPSQKDCSRARQGVTASQISALEILWRTDPRATFSDLLKAEAEGKGPDNDVSPVLLKYDDGYHYQNVFGPLVKLEADEDRALKASMKAMGITVRWSKNTHNTWMARFAFHRGVDMDLKLVPGDEMCLRLPSFASQFAELDRLVSVTRGGASAADDEGAWSGTGFVREIRDGEVVLEIVTSTTEITERMPSTGYIAEPVWRSVTFDRMQMALKQFALDEASVTGYLYHALLGHTVEPQILKVSLPTNYSAPGLPELNPSQISAVRTVLLRPLSLIQGPPGTGKTVTSASIVYHLSRQAMGQVLVAAPSNVAVDHLTEKIAATGLKVVRVMARSREAGGTGSLVEHLCLHTMVWEAAPPGSELRRLLTLKRDFADLSPKDQMLLKKLSRASEKAILSAADVICVTCAGSGDSIFSGMRFKQVLIDEATQAAEPECLIPVVQGCKQLVLVGDHCQVSP